MTRPKQHNYAYTYNGKNISYNAWSTGDITATTSVLFLGSLQFGKLARWVAESCPPDTLVVESAPHWHAKDDGSDIPEFMFNFTLEALSEITKHIHAEQLKIMAESQAVPGVIRALLDPRFNHLASSLVLLQPLGLNAASYIGSPHQRIRAFKSRIKHNMAHQFGSLLIDMRLRYNHLQMSKYVLGDTSTKRNAQYSSGLAYDSVADLRQLHKQKLDTKIICGSQDKLFPPSEIQHSLTTTQLKIPVQIIRGVPHSPLATKKGIKLLHAAFKL